MADFSDEESGDWGCIDDAIDDLTWIWGAAALFAPLTPIAAPAALGFGWLEHNLQEFKQDPPETRYQTEAVIHVPSVTLPTARSPLQRKVRTVTSILVDTSPVVRALIQSVERGKGAKKANDKDWQRKHLKTERLMKKRLLSNFSDLTKSMASASTALKGSPVDVKITHDDLKTLRTNALKGKLPPGFVKVARETGFTGEQISDYRKRAAKLYVKKMWTARLSYYLRITSHLIELSSAELRRRG